MVRRRSRFCSIFFGILTLLLTATMGFGATWYVANGGDNDGEGTRTDPFETIQYAVNWAEEGDTVMVETGTYAENISIAKNRLTLRAADEGLKPVIDGGNYYGILLTGNGLTVEGFRIENATDGIYIDTIQTSDVTLTSNWIEGFTQNGIRFEEDIEGCSVLVSKNTIRGWLLWDRPRRRHGHERPGRECHNH